MSDNILQDQLTAGLDAILRAYSTPHQYGQRILVFQKDKMKLYYYQAKKKQKDSPPLLITFSTVNKSDILDLSPQYSFINELNKNGIDVYLIDWGYPDDGDFSLSLDDYVNYYLQECVAFIKESNACDSINLLGICQGGVMALCYAALHQDIKKLILISTPVDFHTRDNLITALIKRLDVDHFIRTQSNLPGSLLTQFFVYLRPFDAIGKKYLRFTQRLADKSWTEKFVRVEKWLHDAPDQSGTAFVEFVRELYQGNKLIKGEFHIRSNLIDLKNITMPVLNIMAKDDEIVPPSASRALKQYVGTKNYFQRVIPGGHIGIYVSDNTLNTLPKMISRWLVKSRSI